MKDIFGEGGLIANFHEAYEHRDGQVKMAEAVMRAFDEKRHLVVEAGTGTGKTLAYLVPAIAAALGKKRRVIISTGTKNLQEQLMEKDITFLQRVMPKKFTAAYMKGRSNYACLNRIYKAEDQPFLEGLNEIDYFEEIRHWSRESKTGDRAELRNLPENLSFWNRINARSEICLGQKCPDFEPCFITRMRARAEDADIIIVNHHLFFADLAVRGSQYGRVIPDYSAVIFDEAHLIEDIAADYFGLQVSSFQIEEIIRDTDMLPIDDAIVTSSITKVSARVIGHAEQFWHRFSQGRGAEGRYPLVTDNFFQRNREGDGDATPLGQAYEELDGSLARLQTELDVYSDKIAEVEAVVRRISQSRDDLKFIINQADRNFVYWLERRGRGVFLQASPVDVSDLLNKKLFDKVQTCVLTSATLASNGSFNFIRDRLGLDRSKTDTLVAPSAFDYEKQAIIYLPKGMPD